MKIFFTILLSALLFNACIFLNECGASTNYYSDCIESYDAMGIYSKKCPDNNLQDLCSPLPSREVKFEECLNCN